LGFDPVREQRDPDGGSAMALDAKHIVKMSIKGDEVIAEALNGGCRPGWRIQRVLPEHSPSISSCNA
jgi:hypothetical protein